MFFCSFSMEGIVQMAKDWSRCFASDNLTFIWSYVSLVSKNLFYNLKFIKYITYIKFVKYLFYSVLIFNITIFFLLGLVVNSNNIWFVEILFFCKSIQRSGQSQFELESYIKHKMQNSKRDVYLGSYLNG